MFLRCAKAWRALQIKEQKIILSSLIGMALKETVSDNVSVHEVHFSLLVSTVINYGEQFTFIFYCTYFHPFLS